MLFRSDESASQTGGEQWLLTGHHHLGRRIARSFGEDEPMFGRAPTARAAPPLPSATRGARTSPQPSPPPSLALLGRVTRWLPADEASGEPALFHCVHDDGERGAPAVSGARHTSAAPPAPARGV